MHRMTLGRRSGEWEDVAWRFCCGLEEATLVVLPSAQGGREVNVPEIAMAVVSDPGLVGALA